jgi:hypothetical protein
MKMHHRFLTELLRFTAASVLTVIIASGASAYTLVMRDGRRVEIPENFIVTKSTLTYQVTADIQVTVQLASIDVTATERLNKQRSGSLMETVPVQEVKTARPTRSSRTITNEDLETYRRTRVESEVAYEKRRKELGLPSAEETRRELALVAERTREQLLKNQAVEGESESYWRGRASELRADISATDARINAIRLRLDEIPLNYSFGAFTTVVPFGLPAGRFDSFGDRGPRPGVFSQRTVRSSVGVRLGVPVGRGHLSINARRFDGFSTARGINPFGRGAILSLPFQTADYGLEQINLVNQLNELTSYRAGLQSRWRDLEEQARRAGAYPGWLR